MLFIYSTSISVSEDDISHLFFLTVLFVVRMISRNQHVFLTVLCAKPSSVPHSRDDIPHTHLVFLTVGCTAYLIFVSSAGYQLIPVIGIISVSSLCSYM